MENYRYKGRKQDGKMVTGEIAAVSVRAVVDQLRQNQVIPLEVEPVTTTSGNIDLQALTLRWPTDDEVILFSRQMQTLLKARVPIIRALQGVSRGMRNYRFQKAVELIMKRLGEGQSLSAAMAEHPKIFSTLYINMIHIGEQTGGLAESFGQLYRYLEIDRNTRRQVKSALRYPAVVVSLMMAAILVITNLVLPNFQKFFQSATIELPWQTLALLKFSQFTTKYWILIFIVLVGGLVALVSYAKTPAGAIWWGEWKFKMPLVGSIIKRGTMARFARSFAMGARAGLAMLKTLESASQAIDNKYVESKIHEMINSIERGETVLNTAVRSGLFTPLVLQMLAVGEESGNMDEMMQDVAQYYEQEVEYDIKSLAPAIEMLLTLTMGALVAILAMGVFLPMWEMVQASSHK
ncbi:MAG: type II secretion system F family protein [Magnetococcales bacterium]|nr:type II secretion system F family protein [Magnetococcales bacterium]NGZ27377.1 type II secretion system F family protein [Magnetococcales bacterium]